MEHKAGTRRRVAKQGRRPKIDLEEVRGRLLAALEQLNGVFAERGSALLVIALSALCGYNYLLIGDPGTAKTAMARAFCRHLVSARFFDRLLGSFTTIGDLVGRLDLAALQQGIEQRRTEGKLPTAHVVFLDEVLKTSDATLNSLLGVLNDREYDGEELPLWTLGSATNWPEVRRRSEKVEALFDRFQLRCVVSRVKETAAKRQVLKACRTLESYQPNEGTTITLEELKVAHEALKAIPISDEVIDVLISVQARLLREGIEITDRRFAQMQLLLQAMAWLNGHDRVKVPDFEPLVFASWINEKDLAKAQSVLSTCDREFSQSLLARIQEGRQRYRAANAKRLTGEQAAELIDYLTNIAETVGGSLNSIDLSEASKRDVDKALKQLWADFDALYSRFQPQLESKDTGTGAEG